MRHVKTYIVDNSNIVKPTYMLTRKQTTSDESETRNVFKEGLTQDMIEKHLNTGVSG
jgi:hypothetical protein